MDDQEERSILNNIYIGKVKNIVTNINSAFVELGDGQIGYYSLTENPDHVYTKPHSGKKLKEGDEILVQVSRDAVKTKAPVLTSFFSFTGKYSVLTPGKNRIGFSTKIQDQEWKSSMKEEILNILPSDAGVIVRTNAKEASPEELLGEIARLNQQYRTVLDHTAYRTCFSLLYQAPPQFVTSIRDSYAENLEEIVTDCQDIYETLSQYMTLNQPEDLHKLRLYADPLLPMEKLYNLEGALSQATNKNVWLKSGGYLVIEQTEAMVVIDVNTGKYVGKKNVKDTMLKINLEAAQEIGKQLRLRNLSGIIIVDFIDMERTEDKTTLLETLSEIVSRDPVKTTVVDMTRLNLVELTRKKVLRPLHEQMKVAPKNTAEMLENEFKK